MKRMDDITNVLRTKYKQESDQLDTCENTNENEEIVIKLQQKVQALSQENRKLREQIANTQDLQTVVKRLKKYIGRLEDQSGSSFRSSPAFQVPSPLPASQLWSSSSAVKPSPSGQAPFSLPTVESPLPPSEPDSSKIPTNLGSKFEHSPLPVSLPSSPLPASPLPVSPLPAPPLPASTSTLSTSTATTREGVTQMVTLGPGLSLPTKIFNKIKPKKVGAYVANIMAATLSREYMATHSYKGQKAKNGQIKPKLDSEYTESILAHCKSVKFSNMGRDVIEEDIVKAIKYKLNNEEQGWKKQSEQHKDDN